MNEDQIKTWPSVIYLQHGGAKDECEYPGRDDVTWCDHAINESDIEYVRGDRFQDAWMLAVDALEKIVAMTPNVVLNHTTLDIARAALSTLKEKR